MAASFQVAKRHRIEDAFVVAQRAKGWTRDRWEEAVGRFSQW